MINLLYIPLLMFCDRVRGGERFGLQSYSKTIDLGWLSFEVSYGAGGILGYVAKFGYGFALGTMVSDNPIVWVLCSILWWIGEKPSWRKLFNEVSGLQPRESHLMARFALRGFIWSLPCLPLAYFFDQQILYLAAMTIAFPISAWWGYEKQSAFDSHAFTELSRPAILGVIICLLKGL